MQELFTSIKWRICNGCIKLKRKATSPTVIPGFCRQYNSTNPIHLSNTLRFNDPFTLIHGSVLMVNVGLKQRKMANSLMDCQCAPNDLPLRIRSIRKSLVLMHRHFVEAIRTNSCWLVVTVTNSHKFMRLWNGFVAVQSLEMVRRYQPGRRINPMNECVINNSSQHDHTMLVENV